MKKEDQYAVAIIAHMQEMFDEDCENYIDLSELNEDNNATHFAYAMGAIAPAMIIGRLTGQSQNALEFNHMVNRLVMQYSNQEGKDDE